jgi:hypothetical protein
MTTWLTLSEWYSEVVHPQVKDAFLRKEDWALVKEIPDGYEYLTKFLGMQVRKEDTWLKIIIK